MPIRPILLISFFVLLFLVALPLAALSFFSSRSTLQAEIGRNLTSDAAMLMEEVDMMLFERLQNVHSWSHLDIMQEARIGDVDKRLSQFLGGLESGYKGMYHALYFVDPQHRVISSGTPSLIGQTHPVGTEWLQAQVPNGEVFIEALQLSPPYNPTDLVIRAPVHDNYSTQDMGQLYGLFDMHQIFRLLDKAGSSSSGERYIVLLDAQGRTIAATAGLRSSTFLLQSTFADWKPKKGETLFVHEGHPVVESPVLVGYAQSKGYMGYVQMNWSILIFQSTTQAFLPIHALLQRFSEVIVVTMVLAFLLANWISGRIAKPLLNLTAWVGKIAHFGDYTLPNVGGTAEVQALEAAFGQMLQALQLSREQLTQAAKLAVVGEMAAIMAHEVRTPLGILSTSAQMLQQEQNLSPEGKEMTHFILEESVRLKRLVTTLLECARPREPQMHPHNIHVLVKRAVGLLSVQANKKQLLIEQQLQAEHSIIVCDAELLTQVFLNLLMNAIQMAPDAGIIRVLSRVQERYFCLEVADNGPGIAQEDFTHLFDPFFTKRDGGIGLGLTVTRQIIVAHHGSISVSESVWGGACFTLLLPFTQE